MAFLKYTLYVVDVLNVGVNDFLILTVVVLDIIESSVLSINQQLFENLKTPSNLDKFSVS